jgi:phosphoribosylformylglycinamidine (FGAM) synthase PurS component
MNFKAEIDVMPLKELLDPQGKAVEHSLDKLDFDVKDVRIQKLNMPAKNYWPTLLWKVISLI